MLYIMYPYSIPFSYDLNSTLSENNLEMKISPITLEEVTNLLATEMPICLIPFPERNLFNWITGQNLMWIGKYPMDFTYHKGDIIIAFDIIKQERQEEDFIIKFEYELKFYKIEIVEKENIKEVD